MSDQQLQLLKREFLLSPNMETAAAYVATLKRTQPEVSGYRLVQIKKPSPGGRSAWCAWWEDVLEPGAECERCDGIGKYYWGEDDQYSSSCGQCLTTGLGKHSLTSMRLAVFNKVIDHLQGRFLIGEFKEAAYEELGWVGPV